MINTMVKPGRFDGMIKRACDFSGYCHFSGPSRRVIKIVAGFADV